MASRPLSEAEREQFRKSNKEWRKADQPPIKGWRIGFRGEREEGKIRALMHAAAWQIG